MNKKGSITTANVNPNTGKLSYQTVHILPSFSPWDMVEESWKKHNTADHAVKHFVNQIGGSSSFEMSSLDPEVRRKVARKVLEETLHVKPDPMT